jgi:hypothetical protein
MGPLVLPFLCVCLPPESEPEAPPADSYLCQPAFTLDDVLFAPATPYVPQPGDIFLATDQARWARVGHWLAGGAGVHHSGIIFCRPDGRLGLIEAGPFNSVQVEVMDPLGHMRDHVAAGDWVWVRRRRVPLTPEQSERLTAFLEAQDGKPFATLRLVGQLTPFRSRGPLRTWVVGGPRGDRRRWYCSELVTEACVAAGLIDASTARPAATYPRDLFFGRSLNWYLDTHLDLSDWDPPARWTEAPLPEQGP